MQDVVYTSDSVVPALIGIEISLEEFYRGRPSANFRDAGPHLAGLCEISHRRAYTPAIEKQLSDTESSNIAGPSRHKNSTRRGDSHRQ